MSTAQVGHDRYAIRNNVVNVEWLSAGMRALPRVIRDLGFSALRSGQDSAIATILGGQDLLCVINTSGGKSACFIIPTLALNWKTVVFSPLLALMKDQVNKLTLMGVAAGTVNGNRTAGENEFTMRQWMSGQLQMLYVSPERLGNDAFMAALNTVKPDMVTIDEAHCLSQWSDTFRPFYCKIGDYITASVPKVVSAFTATCPPEVEDDIRRVLCMSRARKLSHYLRRDNLAFTADDYRDINQMVDLIQEANGPSIVYCSTITRLEETASHLQRALGAVGLSTTIYHGQMDPKKKEANMDLFMTGKADVVVATNAFGMGVDKPDVRLVVHRDIPPNIEALAQELGRGGRDGKPSRGVTLYSRDSISTQRRFLDNGHPSRADIAAFYNAVCSLTDRKTGLACASAEVIEKHSGVSTFSHRAIRSVLLGANVLATSPVEQRIATVKFLGRGEDEQFHKYYNAVLAAGQAKSDGSFEVDLANLADQVLLTEATAVRHLKDIASRGLLSYSPPPRYTPLRVTGDLGQIDFKRLAQRREQAEQKLDQVLQYKDVPDSERHAFIEKCFGH